MFDLYSRPWDEEEENPLLAPPVPVAAPPAPVVPEPAEPPIPEGFVPLPEQPEEPPIPEGFVKEPPIPEGFVEEPSEKPKEESFLAKTARMATEVPATIPLVGQLVGLAKPEAALKVREGIQETLTGAPDYWEKIKSRWALGREQAVDDQLAYKALSGEVKWEDVKDKLEPDPAAVAKAKGQHWYSEGLLQAVEMLPAMLESLGEGSKQGIGWGTTAAAAAGIAGVAGPQALLPEEAVTVPISAASGYAAGQAYGSYEYWRRQGSGSLYNDLRKEGIDHETAKNVSLGFGVPYAGIEFLQMTKLVPGMKESAAHAIAGGIKQRLAALGKEKVVEYGEQIAQETAQELTQATSEAIAEWRAGVKPPPNKKGIFERALDTVTATASSVPFLMLPKAGVDVTRIATAPGAPVSEAVPPPMPPDVVPPTPPGAFAPSGTAPGVTITPAPGEVPVPPDLAGAPAPAAPVFSGAHPIFGFGTYTEPLVGEVIAVPLGSGAEQLYWNGKPTDRVRRPDGSHDFATNVETADPTWAQPEVTRSSIDAGIEKAPVTPAVAATTPELIEPGEHTSAGAAVTQVTGAHNIAVKEIADTQAQNLQAAGAPKTAQAIQQLAQESSSDATVTAAEFLQQAKVQAAEAQAEAATKATEAATKAAPEAAAAPAAPEAAAVAPAARPFGVPPPLPGVTPPAIPAIPTTPPAPELAAAPAAAPAPAARTEPQAAVVVGGQVFTGDTYADAVSAAHTAVGTDAMGSAEGGWVDPETGRFHGHGIYEAHTALNTAIEEAGGNMEAPAVQEATARFAEAQTRDVEINNQIIQPGGEQVVNPGIKGQEVLVSTRPSQELAVPLAGVTATIEGVDAQGRRATETQPAAVALNDARNDKTALTILLDCLH